MEQPNLETIDTFELMHRRTAGIEVFLNWHRQANILTVMVRDESQTPPVTDEFVVPNDKGLEAFQHPYAYQPKREA